MTTRLEEEDGGFDATVLGPRTPSRSLVFAASRGGHTRRHAGLLQAFADRGFRVVAPHFDRLATSRSRPGGLWRSAAAASPPPSPASARARLCARPPLPARRPPLRGRALPRGDVPPGARRRADHAPGRRDARPPRPARLPSAGPLRPADGFLPRPGRARRRHGPDPVLGGRPGPGHAPRPGTVSRRGPSDPSPGRSAADRDGRPFLLHGRSAAERRRPPPDRPGFLRDPAGEASRFLAS